MANLKKLQAALRQKQADLDVMDDQLMGMPEMAPDAPADMAVSGEFDMLSEKREGLEEEINHMREGIELISQWEGLKNGPWSEEVKGLLGEIDIEIADIAGGEVGAVDDLGGMGDMGDPMAGAPAPMGVPPAPPEPAAAGAVPPPAPEAAPEPTGAPALDAEPAPLEPPMASAGAQKASTSKKNSYQSPDKKAVSASSGSNKEGSIMAQPTPASASGVKEKLAEVKSKREAIKKEAQQRVAAAWTIAKTMLPSAPAEIQKAAAQNLLQNPTRVLNAMLRQTAKNAHYSKEAEKFAATHKTDMVAFATKQAESFQSVHKKEQNDLLEEPSVLASEKKSVEGELKGDPKNASASKTADDTKDAGPQLATYDDGRCYPSKDTTPAEMHADSSKSQTEADHRPMDTINKSEGDKAGKEASAKSKAACGKDCKGCDKCEKKAATEKCSKCEGECKCASKVACGKDCDGCEKCASAKKAAIDAAVAKKAKSKKADLPPMDAPAPEGDMGAPAELGAEPPMDAPAEEMPMDELPVDEGAEGDTSAEVLSDEKKMIVEEKIEEAENAIHALEAEILNESEEELDLAQVFNEDDMEEKVSALANEGDEHTAGNGEEYFAPSAAESMEASLDEPQMASMEDFFSLQGSDNDPLAHLIAGDIKTAEQVAGHEVIPSFTGELANKMESNTADTDNRDNESDHDGDLFAEAIEDQKPEDGGFKRVKQDETNEMEAPKSASKTAPKASVIKKLKPVVASESKPFDIAQALFGNDDEF
jgi:hypothetical protein